MTSMSESRKTITVLRGNDFNIVWTFRDANGNLIDFSNSIFKLCVRSSLKGSFEITPDSVENGVVKAHVSGKILPTGVYYLDFYWDSNVNNQTTSWRTKTKNIIIITDNLDEVSDYTTVNVDSVIIYIGEYNPGGGGSSEGIYIITTNDVTEPSDYNVFSALRALKMFILKDREDQTNFLLKFGDFIDSMITGKGTGIFPDGRIQTDRLEVRGSMTVMDLIINEIHAMAGDWSLSDCGKIDKVEYVSEGTYKLWMQKETETDWTSLDEQDVMYSIVNNLKIGGTDYYTSWMRVVTKNINDNTLTVVLWPDSEVPGGKNYPPAAGYNVTRRGNSYIPSEEEPSNERSQSWLLSSREGRIMFLQNVYKPILEDYNYGLTLGKIPKLKALEKIPVSEGELGVVAQTIIAQNFYQFDYNGNIVNKRVPRGAWSLEVAQGAYPYRFITKQYESPNGTEYVQLEQHTVEHYGCTWGCIVDQTQDEPIWNSPGWVMIQGDKNYHLEFESSNGWQFFINQVNTDITATISYGNRDITNILMASPGVEIEWLRDTDDIPADNSWKPTYVNDQKNVIHLSVSDMGSGWGQKYRKVSFICRVFIPVGEDFEKVENRINIKI